MKGLGNGSVDYLTKMSINAIDFKASIGGYFTSKIDYYQHWTCYKINTYISIDFFIDQ